MEVTTWVTQYKQPNIILPNIACLCKITKHQDIAYVYASLGCAA